MTTKPKAGYPSFPKNLRPDRLVISNIDIKGNYIVITFLFLFPKIKLLHFNLSIELIMEMIKKWSKKLLILPNIGLNKRKN